MKLSFILTGEGTSDLRLVDHIESLLIESGFSEVRGEAPDFRLFPNPVGRSVRAKLEAIIRNFPHSDVIFVHRDADSVGVRERETEVFAAADGVVDIERIIPVIPVKMLETWLLADAAAIKRVAGKADNNKSLQCLPAIRQLEKTHDAKHILLEALCEASQTQGQRLKKFKTLFPEMRARLTLELDSNGPVKDLPSYQHFVEKIKAFSVTRQHRHLPESS